ncbi:MAG: hypothetical protein SGI83_08015 [Bacteroidota bacterium]|nr:hypothetical protein [Bacteroidota bacterium]
MKKWIFLPLIVSMITVQAQSLKDALYGGKLRTDSGTVLRKGDDLSSKIDTSRKKPVEAEKAKPVALSLDSSMKNGNNLPDVTIKAPMTTEAAVKDNNKTWKTFSDSVISMLKQEVIPSKKLKKGAYFVLVDYEIGLDGQVTIMKVIPTPESAFLEEQVKERLSIDTPKLNPVLDGNGKPRKVVKRVNFTLTKD